MHILYHIWLWVLHATGSDDTSDNWYGFWSGFGSDLGEFTILVVLYRKLNCHVDGCHRLGFHHVEGTGYMVCKKHHPRGSGPTAQDVVQAHIDSDAEEADNTLYGNQNQTIEKR